MDRIGRIERKTAETAIVVRINLDGSGQSRIQTPLPFLSHMLEQIARHGGFDLEVDATGDVEIDGHHTTEDLGIVLGKAVLQALGDRKGIQRYGAATLTAPDGAKLLLVYEGDGWRVDGSALDLYSQESPEAALASFVRAFNNKRYDVLLRFVPESKREGLSAEQLQRAWEGEQKQQVEQLTQALQASLPNVRVEVLGTRATVAYGAGGTVELVHELGAWRIEDF